MNGDEDKIYMTILQKEENYNFVVYDICLRSFQYLKDWYNIQIYICRSKHYILFWYQDGFKRKLLCTKNL